MLSGGDPSFVYKVIFRVKDKTKAASNFSMKFMYKDGLNPPSETLISWSEGIGPIWNHRYFTLNACNFCDDIFAEVADITFMDAWLPEYSGDWRGHSIVLVRKPVLSDLIDEAIQKGVVSAKYLGIEAVIKSQQGVLRSKRGQIAERIRIAKKQGKVVPKWRVSLYNVKLSICEKLQARMCYFISLDSPKQWLAARKDLSTFGAKLKPYTKVLQKVEHLKKLKRLFRGMLRKLVLVFR